MPRRSVLLLLLSVVLVLTAPPLRAQETEIQYKRLGIGVMRALDAGDLDTADAEIDAYLDAFPGDPEALYLRAALHTQRGDTTAALATARQAVEAGLPFGRLLAGPRPLLAPLTATAGFRAWADSVAPALVHGPLLGDLTFHSARFWVRTAGPARVRVVIEQLPDPEPADTSRTDSTADGAAEAPPSNAATFTGQFADLVRPTEIRSAEVRTSERTDFTAVIRAHLLKADTHYRYHVLVDDSVQPGAWTFRTPPQPGAPGAFVVGFGGGAGYTPDRERMWRTITARNPLAFLLLGDNVYIDTPEQPAVQRYAYYRRQSRPEFREFGATTAVYAVWDDHDFTDNDGWGGPEIDEPEWKRDVWDVFRHNWNNPGYGQAGWPGAWFNFRLGDVEFFMLDSRYYREDPNPDSVEAATGRMAPRSMLGPTQKAWLLSGLQRSTARFKVIASPVPWAEGVKPGSRDTWDGFAEEREEIFSTIEQQRIDGVVLLSADRHRSDVWKIERPRGYDFYEFESSRLTNIHVHRTFEEAEFSYNEKNSFGLLTFDTTLEDPEVTYTIVSIDGEDIHSTTVPLSRLTHPPQRPTTGR